MLSSWIYTFLIAFLLSQSQRFISEKLSNLRKFLPYICWWYTDTHLLLFILSLNKFKTSLWICLYKSLFFCYTYLLFIIRQLNKIRPSHNHDFCRKNSDFRFHIKPHGLTSWSHDFPQWTTQWNTANMKLYYYTVKSR